MSSSENALRSRLQRWGVIAAIWSIVVLVVAGDCFLQSTIKEDCDISFFQTLEWAAPTWYIWALLTPLILYLAKVFRPGRQGWLGRICLLVLVGILIATIKVGVAWMAQAVLAGQSLGASLTADKLIVLLMRRIPVNFGIFSAIVVVSYLVTIFQEQRDRDLKASQLETQLAVAELRALKMQLQPHFVLNVLNTIAAMIHRSPDRAEEMTVRLGELLRMVLDSREVHTVPLSTEVAFLEKYLEIEQVRFGDQLQLSLDVTPGNLDPDVPNLVLQPFVENAIKHRSLRSGTPTVVEIKIWTESDRVRMRIADNGPGIACGGDPPRNGLGIVNTRARLDALYGDNYQLGFSAAQPSGLVIDVSLPMQANLTTEEEAKWPAA